MKKSFLTLVLFLPLLLMGATCKKEEPAPTTSTATETSETTKTNTNDTNAAANDGDANSPKDTVAPAKDEGGMGEAAEVKDNAGSTPQEN